MKKNKKKSKNIDIKSLGKKTLFAWIKHCTFIFMIFLTILSAWGLYLLYKNIYNYSWTEERKKTFLESKEKGVVFNEKSFREAINVIDNRNYNYNSDIGEVKDIFNK